MPGSRTRSTPGQVWRVEAGQDLQRALDRAAPGDQIVLAQGATFTGNFVLAPKSSTSTDWIILRTEFMPTAAGTRVSPELSANVARIVTPNQNPALFAAPGARRWRLMGVQIEHKAGAIYNYGIVVLGRGDEKPLAQQPSEIVLDRMYIHGSLTDGASRCIAFNGQSLAVIDSWISECHAKGNDAQGIAGWAGSGPFLIENNHIEGSGQAIMFGGADPVIADVLPSDIVIRRNHLFKPLDWGNGRWTVKATFELKDAQRVLFEDNVLENHWSDAQSGFAMLFQAVSQNDQAPWSTIQDVLVQNNVIRNSTSALNLLARYNAVVRVPTSRVAVVNNLFIDVGIDPFNKEPGRIFQMLGELEDVTLANNTFVLGNGATYALLFDGKAGLRSNITGNVFPSTDYGIFGSGRGSGTSALAAYAPGATVSRNVLPGQSADSYPTGNIFPSSPMTDPTLRTTSLAATCQSARVWLTQQRADSLSGADCGKLGRALGGVGASVP